MLTIDADRRSEAPAMFKPWFAGERERRGCEGGHMPYVYAEVGHRARDAAIGGDDRMTVCCCANPAQSFSF
jgi:hypothetical protein